MRSKFIEVTNNKNWGKFILLVFDQQDACYHSPIAESMLLSAIGIRDISKCFWLMDLQTREGGLFYPHGLAKADLDKTRIWVCPMFEPLLVHLYDRFKDTIDLDSVPQVIELPRQSLP